MSLFVGILMGLYLSAYAWPIHLVIITDDHGYSEISALGNPVSQSPNLDRLLDQSQGLSDYHVAPICKPIRGQLLTGLDAVCNGAHNVSSRRDNLIHTLSD